MNIVKTTAVGIVVSAAIFLCLSLSARTAASAVAPDLKVTKTCAVNGPQSVLCTVTVSNIGTAASVSPITLTDVVSGAPSNGLFTGGGGTLPISCTPGAGPILPISCHAAASLAPSQSKTALFSFKLPNGGSFTNCATVTEGTSVGTNPDPNPANNTHICASVTVQSANAPDLQVAKTCVVNGPHSVLCTVTVTNIGTAASVSPITLTDVVSGAPSNGLYTGAGGTLPISCTPGAGPILPISCHAAASLAPSQSKTALFSFKLPNGGSFTNCATVTEGTSVGTNPDPNPANNTHICASVTVAP
jgi:hypothetical protein